MISLRKMAQCPVGHGSAGIQAIAYCMNRTDIISFSELGRKDSSGPFYFLQMMSGKTILPPDPGTTFSVQTRPSSSQAAMNNGRHGRSTGSVISARGGTRGVVAVAAPGTMAGFPLDCRLPPPSSPTFFPRHVCIARSDAGEDDDNGFALETEAGRSTWANVAATEDLRIGHSERLK